MREDEGVATSELSVSVDPRLEQVLAVDVEEEEEEDGQGVMEAVEEGLLEDQLSIGDHLELERPLAIFTTSDKRRLFIVEDIIKACAGCRPSFLFTGSVVEQAPGNPIRSSLRLLSNEKTIERDLTLSLRYEPPSPKFSRSCPTSASYRLKVSRGEEFLYLTRGLTKKVSVDKLELVVTWGHLELAFGNSEELGIFVSALRYVDFVDNSALSSSSLSTGERGTTSRGGKKKEEEGLTTRSLSSQLSSIFTSSKRGQISQWLLPVSITIAVAATVSYQFFKRKT